MISRSALYHRLATHLRGGIGIRLDSQVDGTLVPTVTLPPFNETRAIVEDALAAFVKDFAERILHGDEVHRAWLMEAADAYCHLEPLPDPRQQQPAPQVLDESHAALAASRKKVEFLQNQIQGLIATGDRLGNEVDGLRSGIGFADRLAQAAAMTLALRPNSGEPIDEGLRSALRAYLEDRSTAVKP